MSALPGNVVNARVNVNGDVLAIHLSVLKPMVGRVAAIMVAMILHLST